ncbi:MAG: putative DCC family thiol-disulfide oxidoreductase YuxK [Flavobacteriales bacterium]|jgi:predicted DCC family thiol-disulfide oxidoreductase YuxK
MAQMHHIIVIYDGECPFCKSYCTRIRIQDAVGQVTLLNAREPSALKDEVTSLGLDIDRGMIVKVNEQVYYGADAINILSLLSSRYGVFNRINYWIFRSKIVSFILYPFLRDCRNLALWVLNIPKINNLNDTEKL